MAEIESILQRCRELSVQAANTGTTTIEDRQACQDEIDSLRSEIDRIAEQTEYNRMNLLDGSCCRQSSSDNVGVKLISATDDVKLTTYRFSVDAEPRCAELTTGTLGFATPSETVKKEDAGTIQLGCQPGIVRGQADIVCGTRKLGYKGQAGCRGKIAFRPSVYRDAVNIHHLGIITNLRIHLTIGLSLF